MKKKVLQIAFMFSICSLLFTGCQSIFTEKGQDQELEETDRGEEEIQEESSQNNDEESGQSNQEEEQGENQGAEEKDNEGVMNGTSQETTDNPVILYQPDFEEDWQVAYAAVLQEELEKAGTDRFSAYYQDEELAHSFSLYDIDKDQIPELIVHRGNCEANYHSTCQYKHIRCVPCRKAFRFHRDRYIDPYVQEKSHPVLSNHPDRYKP